MAGKGGARAGAGRKKKPSVPTSAVSPEEQRRSKRIYEALVRPADPKDSPEIVKWREIVNHEPAYLWKMFEHSEGRAIHTVNHLHDKPLEVHATVTIAEVVRKVRERKEEYERSR